MLGRGDKRENVVLCPNQKGVWKEKLISQIPHGSNMLMTPDLGKTGI